MRPGECSLEVEGSDLSSLGNESGGHRIQRVPPTERKGRVHTSTVTVAVVAAGNIISKEIPKQDLKIEWYSGTGAGGQNRNKVKNSCRITHIPSGEVATAQTRDRSSSFNLAMSDIQHRVNNQQKIKLMQGIASDRKQQIGSGMRGDKIRTIRFQDDSATDHKTGKRITAEKYLKGYMNLLWP